MTQATYSSNSLLASNENDAVRLMNTTIADYADKYDSGSMNTLSLGSIGQLYETCVHYWPTHYCYTPNKTEQAFKVVKALMDQNMIKLTTIKQFVNAVTEVAKHL